jgi:hypothetical protein
MPSIQSFAGVTGLALFLVAISYSQVIIRERVTIDPKPSVQAQASSATDATLRYELQYDGPVRSPELDFMRLQELVCGVFDSGPINSSLTVPAQSGLWNFSFRIHTPIVSNQYARFTVWLGEDVILKDSLLINCGSTCQINHPFGFRISNTFNFSANGQVFYGDQSFLDAIPSGQQHCTAQMWHPGLPVNLRIVSGGHLGQFADLNGTPLGHDVTVQGFNVDQISFLANGTEPDSISDFVTIEASSFGITRTATIEVFRISESPIWLAMDAQGDVSYGAEMSILAQALDMFQQEVSAGTGVTYMFEIIEGSEWGSLFRGTVEGTVISGVRPTNDFFSRGMATIGFRARKAEPAIPQRVTVKVSASDPDIHPGTYSFNVLPSPLAISVTPPTVSYGQQTVISVQKKNPDGTVSPWPQDAGFSYEIIKGHNAGYVLHPDTARRNDFFNGQSDTIHFVALEESPQPDTVEVQFYIYVFNEGGGIATAAFDPIQPNPTLRRTGLASVTVLKGDSLDHFTVGLEKDTIAFTETSRIFVVAKDSDSNDVALANDALLQFSIDSTAYGSFIAANGDTVPSPLSKVPYSDAKAGNIRFAAVNKNPDSVVSFKIIAKLQEDTTKAGDATLVLVGKRLRININSPKRIWPTLPEGRSGGNPNNRNRKDSISIAFRMGLLPAVSESVLVKTRFITRSGGHDHENTPPDSLMGTLRHLGSSFAGTGEIRLQTDSEGKFLIRYTAPLFGGRIEFLARSITDSTISAADTLDVRVDSLIALGADSTYELVGAPDNHSGTNDPCRTTPPRSLHYNNHHGTSATITAIDSIAANYNRFHAGVRLRINDISLEHGGLFDLKNDWVYRDSVHWEHRIGKSADIGYSGINRQNECVTRLAMGDMRALIGQFTTGAVYEHSDHFHIRMR